MHSAFVYILLCADGSYYTGKTDKELDHRLWEHQNGVYGGYTSTRRPVTLMWSQPFPTYLDAMAAERQIKTWTRAKKEALIKGDFSLLHELAECKNESHFAKKKK